MRADIHAIRALNIAARFGPCYRNGREVVICGRSNLPYGASAQTWDGRATR